MSHREHAITRRSCARALVGAVLAAISRNSKAAAVPAETPLTWDAASGPDNASELRYRADAQVLLLGLPLLHRAGVGGGSAAWREYPKPQGALRFLEFTGFSRPDRAAGLNRLGFIQEMARFSGNDAAESLYFGLMTSSPEENAEDARKALHSHAPEVAYSVVDGHISPAAVETATAHFTAPAQWSTENRRELVERARMAIESAPRNESGHSAQGGTALPFLQAVAGMLRQPGLTETRYVYNGRTYRMWMNRAPDAKAAAYFQKHGLLSTNGKVICGTGRLRREAGGKEISFRIWFDPGAKLPVPLRIEYQAKSYLRLTFEAEPAA